MALVSFTTDFAEFEWDEKKNAANIKKHGLSFIDAIDIFKDEFLISFYDQEHSAPGEDRFKSLGRIKNFIILMVVHVEKSGRQRIISARIATKRETEEYYGQYWH